MHWTTKAVAILIGVALAPLEAMAFDLGRSGISLNPPARGWKVEQHHDAAIEVWHLRAEQWQPPSPQSGLIAVTVSTLEGDPWPDPAALRDAAARTLRDEMLGEVRQDTPFDLTAGRFHIAGEDLFGMIGLGEAPAMPISARLLVIRTGDGALLITAFSVLPVDQAPFAGLFGADGILTATGPGAEALNGAPSGPPAQTAAPQGLDPVADPAIRDLLEQMQGGFDSKEGE